MTLAIDWRYCANDWNWPVLCAL